MKVKSIVAMMKSAMMRPASPIHLGGRPGVEEVFAAVVVVVVAV